MMTLAWWRTRPLLLVLAAGLGVLFLGVAWYLGSPLFIHTRLVEADQAGGQQTVVAQGTFSDRDAVHRGSGQARIVRDAAGRVRLRFENFRVTNGPDLWVFLTPHPAPDSHDEVNRDALQIGKLKAAEGAFTYELPAGTDPSRYRAVVIYCVPFRVIFSVAPLRQ